MTCSATTSLLPTLIITSRGTPSPSGQFIPEVSGLTTGMLVYIISARARREVLSFMIFADKKTSCFVGFLSGFEDKLGTILGG
jgi:hypothetical protein